MERGRLFVPLSSGDARPVKRKKKKIYQVTTKASIGTSHLPLPEATSYSTWLIVIIIVIITYILVVLRTTSSTSFCPERWGVILFAFQVISLIFWTPHTYIFSLSNTCTVPKDCSSVLPPMLACCQDHHFLLQHLTQLSIARFIVDSTSSSVWNLSLSTRVRFSKWLKSFQTYGNGN